MNDLVLEPERPATLQRHKLTVDDLYRMVEAGIIQPDDPLELIDGDLIDMAPIGPLHQGTVDLLTRIFVSALAEPIVRVQGPIWITQHTQLQPDLTVLRARSDFYRRGRATPSDCLLVVEVGDTTVRGDREEKIPRYGKAGIPEAWLIDLEARELVIYAEPGAAGYGRAQGFGATQSVSPRLLPEVSVRLQDLFPE